MGGEVEVRLQEQAALLFAVTAQRTMGKFVITANNNKSIFIFSSNTFLQ